MQDINRLPVIDVEASGLDQEDSYPIEIAFALEDGTIHNFLIKPLKKWTYWCNTAQGIHGITQAQLATEGMPAKEVAKYMNELLDGKTVYCDALRFDTMWIDTLYKATRIKRRFEIASLQSQFKKVQSKHFYSIKNHLFSQITNRHRASADVKVLQEAFEQSKLVADVNSAYQKGQQVFIRHQPDLGNATVINPCVPTDYVSIRGNPVKFYVELEFNNSGKVGRYHECNVISVKGSGE